MKGIIHQYSYQLMLNVFCFLTLILCAVPLFSQELQWKVLGHLQQPRTGFGTAVIGRGKVLVIGGFVEQQGIQENRLRGKISSSCEVIDGFTRQITVAAPMIVPHAKAAILQTSDSNVVIVSGLTTDSITTPICELFDRRQNRWRVLGKLAIGRHGHSAAFINQDEIIVVGGRALFNYAPSIAEAEIFNIRTGRSRLIEDFPCKNSEASSAESRILAQSRSVFWGGRSGDGYQISNIYQYDTISGHWLHLSRYPGNAHTMDMLRLFDGRLFLSGGVKRKSNEPQGNPNRFIGVETAQGFSVIGTKIKPLIVGGIGQWNNDLILSLGGHDEKRVSLSSTEWFDFKTNQGFEGSPLQMARAFCIAVSLPEFDILGNQRHACILVIGGIDAQNRLLSSVEILETTNPQLIDVPSAEIASRRRQQLLTSPTVIITLTAFILVLILALLYLLVQVLIIKQKATLPVWDNEPLEVKQ